MTKPRIHGVAKDLEIDKKEVVELIRRVGTKAKNHMSTLENNELDIIFDYFTQLYAVAEFSFLEEKLKQMEERKAGIIEEELAGKPVNLDEPIGKKSRVVDTRTTNVDLEKFDTEKIEELIGDKIDEDVRQKERIKKTPTRGKYDKPASPVIEPPKPKKAKKEIIEVAIPDEISVGEFASKLKKNAAEVVKALMQLGVMASISQLIDFETASLIGEELGAKITREIIITDEDILFGDNEDAPESLISRSPVVVVMGHVDHGKTSLLDAIRETSVAAGEAGGITQHIGAHRVKIHDKEITFLDTPGHEAFTSMRARGAQITDIAILVVAADDGIMPQTVEAINHAKAAGVAVIVAINKIDKEGANIDKVKQELTEYGMVAEEWGGDTICVPVSAKKRMNLDNLLEMVILVSEMKELKANPNKAARGTVIEAKIDKNRGPVASVLVQGGTLKSGDIIIAGTAVGRVRAMTDDKGKNIKSAGPSIPVEILGFGEAPEGGDLFYAVQDEKLARAVAEKRKIKEKSERKKALGQIVSLDALFDQIKQGQMKELNLIIKADVQGSVEAMCQSLVKLSNEEVRVKIVHSGVGSVTESDIMLASASGAIIIGFNVRPTSAIMDSAASQDVEIRLYRVIYQAIEEVEAALKGMLEPQYKENVLGHAEVRQVFKITGAGTIAGCYVLDGKIARNSEVRLVRDSVVIHEGVLNSLKRFKDDVKEVVSGYECGCGIERYNDLKVGDIIESFIMEEVKR